MKALSLMQPWATLVVIGAKRFETRSWRTDYRGELLVHASKNIPKSARDLAGTDMFARVLAAAGYSSWEQLPTGAFLGSVQLVHCWPAEWLLTPRYPGAQEVAFGDFSFGRWAFELSDAVQFAKPILARGQLGIFEADWFPGKS